MGKEINRFIYWAPRILSILFICFLALFSLDVFSSETNFWQTFVGLFIHNIPTIILLIVLIISWKHELVGGVIFTSAGIFYTTMILKEMLEKPIRWYMLSWILTIAGPAFFIGSLFIVNWRKKHAKTLSKNE